MEGLIDTVEHISEVQKKVSVRIPQALLNEEISAAISRFASKASLKGFRPGKAPKDIVEKLYGPQIRYEAMTKLIDRSFQEVLRKNDYAVVGEPKVDFAPVEGTTEISYTAEFSIYPKPKIKGYEAFEVSVEKREPTEEEISNVIDGLLRNKADVKPIEDRSTIQEGDIVAGEIEVCIDGADAERPEPLIVKLGTGAVPEEVEKALIGKPLEEMIVVESTIPETHQEESLRGKKAIYKVRIQKLYSESLPELNDEFVASLGGEEKTVEDLRASVRKRLDAEYEAQRDADIDRAVVRQLIERNPFELPEKLILDEVKVLARRAKRKEPIEEIRAEFEAEAIERVKAAIVIDSIVEAEKLHATAEDIETHLQGLAASLNISLKEVKGFFEKENRYMELFMDQSRQKGFKFLRERVKIK